jgi:hypothetical protein
VAGGCTAEGDAGTGTGTKSVSDTLNTPDAGRETMARSG